MEIFKNIVKKVIIFTGIIILDCCVFLNSVRAVDMNSANVYMLGDCGQLLKYNGTIVKVSYVEYIDGQNHYPAYCLDKTKSGVETTQYSVLVQDAIKDVGLWRIIVNGYPYKNISELGVDNKEEAFTATKQAVYCYIHGNKLSDYEAIGEAGNRTLKAMNLILNNANNSTETKISNTIIINKNIGNWEQDKKDKDYVSKIYEVNSAATIDNYIVKLNVDSVALNEAIKITDENNNEKKEFLPKEKFKILIPIKNLKEGGNFKIQVESKVRTKPVLYGIAPNSNYQDYALTTSVYEDGYGEIDDNYIKNDTKLLIIKQDEESKKKLSGVEFELLDENMKSYYTGLKTNEDGKIILENIIPGRYFLKEINTVNGYLKSEELFKIDLLLNEQITVVVNNRKEEKPQIEVLKNKITTSSNEIKKLPKTGM